MQLSPRLRRISPHLPASPRHLRVISPQVLAAYDVEMPAGLVPICADGEVEEFVLLPIREVREG